MAHRLHFLDWLRVVLVGFVVYAHLTFCGAQVGRPGDDGTVDDHAFNFENPHHLAVRWTAVARQWCIPLLFWTSGAASVLSFDGSITRFGRGLRRIGAITVVGVAGNAAVWLLGPRNEQCSFRRPCEGQGIIFDFTEDPYDGEFLPYVNQMWYTIALLIVTCLNWPVLKLLCGQGQPLVLAAQGGVSVSLYGALIAVAKSGTPSGYRQPFQLFMWFAISETALLLLAAVPVSGKCPSWLNVRLIHYACALVVVSQLAGTEFAPTPIVNDVSMGYVLYLVVCVNRWFQLGAIMTGPRCTRRGDRGGTVEPIMSSAWPVAILSMVLCAPSTNWAMAGLLPYPFLARPLDRFLYVSGTVLAMFIVDRCSRDFYCRPVPQLLAHGALVLYTFQVVFITVFLHAFRHSSRQELRPYPSSGDGVRYEVVVLVLSICSSLALAGVFTLAGRRRAAARSPCSPGGGSELPSSRLFAGAELEAIPSNER